MAGGPQGVGLDCFVGSCWIDAGNFHSRHFVYHLIKYQINYIFLSSQQDPRRDMFMLLCSPQENLEMTDTQYYKFSTFQ